MKHFLRSHYGKIILGATLIAASTTYVMAHDNKAAATKNAAYKNFKIPLEMRGNFMQSGVIIGKTTPHATVSIGEIGKEPIVTSADKNGNFVLGLDRDAASLYEIKISVNGKSLTKQINVFKLTYKETVVNGLPPAKVNPPESAEPKINADSIIKRNAWNSNDYEIGGFMQQFRWPVDKVRITSPWGAVRRLNGELQRPHYGVDAGAPKGTPLYAPADGIVILAEPDLYFEGGMVALDHGQGLISYTMHMSKIDVINGQKITKGTKVGEVGSTGRSTGPHLHWSLKWRVQQLDPELMTKPLPHFTSVNENHETTK